MRGGEKRRRAAVILLTLLFITLNLSATKSVFIESGASSAKVAKILRNKGLIGSVFWFKLYLIISFQEKELCAGYYEFADDEGFFSIIESLTSGQESLKPIVFKPGERIVDLVAEIQELTELESGRIKKAFKPGRFGRFFVGNPPNIEGFLMPETYYFRKSLTPEVIVDHIFLAQMKRLREYFPSQIDKGRISHSLYRIVILASIIENEAQMVLETPIISSVFHNRLRKNMPLGASPTINYLLGRKSGFIKRKETQIKNPYNTYLYRGLPPSPISSPSKSSLFSAALPAKTPYLFFVSRNDGGHHFSRSFKEHDKYKKLYERYNPRQR